MSMYMYMYMIARAPAVSRPRRCARGGAVSYLLDMCEFSIRCALSSAFFRNMVIVRFGDMIKEAKLLL